MSCVQNNTARQYNLKAIGPDGNRVTVRLAPGFNVINDDHWSAFIKPKLDPYVKSLKDAKKIDFGSKIDDMELEKDPDTATKSKSVKAPVSPAKAKAEAEAKAEAKAKAEVKAEAEAKAKAEADAKAKANKK